MVGPRIAVLAFALLAVSAALFARPPASRQPLPCPPCFVCIQGGGAQPARIPQPECPLPRS
ncbi:MAG TPA: hypothetical protein VJS45_19235 [Acidimicrobiia bacterium]|nr:hypothetical protein [Acidimicrobiia bacterium]